MVKKLLDFIKRLLGSSKPSETQENKGFTLVELIVVIAILGILAVAVLVAIDPIDKINAGNDTKVQNNVRSIYDGAIRYYSANSQFPASITAIKNSGELKSEPLPPSTYSPSPYRYVVSGTDVSVCGQVKSKAQLGKASGDPTNPAPAAWIFASNGKLCYNTSVTSCTTTSTYYPCP